MRILIINNDAPPLGGAEYHVKLLSSLLQSKGHTVDCFYPYEHYISLSKRNVRKAFNSLIKDNVFDVVHVHNLEYKFSFLLDILHNMNIRIVQTLHDFRYICASGSFFRKGKICTACMGGKYYEAALKGCFSFLSASNRFVKETLFRMDPIRINKIACYISPSKNLMNVFREGGFTGKMVNLYNFLDLPQYNVPTSATEPYLLYFGRLAEDKGLMTLLDAVKGTGLKLKIAGKGFMEKAITERISNEQGLENIEMLGFLQGRELFEQVGKSKLVIIPSEWWENLPFTVLESFALRKPVVASNLGGIPELVTPERGLLFKAGDPLDLREKILSLFYDDKKLEDMGRNGFAFVNETMSPNTYYEKILDIYAADSGQ